MPDILRPFDPRSPVRQPLSKSLPTSVWQAVWRGARNQCPSCARPKLFVRYLKPMQTCLNCSQDWTHHQADDFPAYLSILITGHLLAPIIIALVNSGLPGWAVVTAILLAAVALLASLLQPAKGAVIAIQWWLGLHGFESPENKEQHRCLGE